MADVDQDSRDELVVINAKTNAVEAYRMGADGMERVCGVRITQRPTALAASDVDGDGRKEILVGAADDTGQNIVLASPSTARRACRQWSGRASAGRRGDLALGGRRRPGGLKEIAVGAPGRVATYERDASGYALAWETQSASVTSLVHAKSGALVVGQRGVSGLRG